MYWDDDQVHIVSPEIALKYGLAPGQEFSEEQLQQFLYENGIRRAKDQALRYLEIRPHSRKELFRKLRQKGFHPMVIEKALEDLANVDLVNDAQFARLFIQNELTLRPCGRRLLEQKLAIRGISGEIFEPLLDEIYQAQPEATIAHQIAEKYLRRIARDSPPKRKEKLIRHLKAKGFDWDIISNILLEFEGPLGEEDSGD